MPSMRIIKDSKYLFYIFALLCVTVEQVIAMDGHDIMQMSQERHQSYPYVYEEQTMVLEDKFGHRSTKKMNRYLRAEEDGSAKLLLLFTYPEEIKGFALIANRDIQGVIQQWLYLPGLRPTPMECGGEDGQSQFLGTDFSIESLIGETLEDYTYVKRKAKVMDGVMHYQIDVYEKHNKEHLLRTHFIRQDNLVITKTKFYDKQGKIDRMQGFHDINVVFEDAWQANHILMQDMKERHQSLIKTERRVFSEDYVPIEIFTLEWLQKNFPYVEPDINIVKDETQALPDLFESHEAQSTVQ